MVEVKRVSKAVVMTMVALLTVVSAYGQRERNVVYKVGVGELIYTPPVESRTNAAGKVLKDVAEVLMTGQTNEQLPQYAEAVRASLVNSLSHVTRLRPFDGGFSHEELASGIPALCADGTIANISTVSKSETRGEGKNKTTVTSYRALVSVTVNLKNAHDGTVVDSHTFTVTDTEQSWMASKDKAVNHALEYLTARMTARYKKIYPLSASIIEGGTVKKDKQKDVYIDLGTADGVYKGLHFDVFVVKHIAGKEAKSEIGRLAITEVQGDDISLCRVTKGGSEIKSALDKGLKLLITSR